MHAYNQSGNTETSPAKYYDRIAALTQGLKDKRGEMESFKTEAIMLLEGPGRFELVLYKALYAIANHFPRIIPQKLRHGIQQFYDVANDPLLHIEHGYKRSLNGLQDSLMRLDAEAHTLSDLIQHNLDRLGDMRQGNLNLDEVWEIIIDMTSKHGVKTSEQTQKYMKRSREDMPAEETEIQRDVIIGDFQKMLEAQQELLKLLIKAGDATIKIYGRGLREYLVFMETQGAVRATYKAAEGLMQMDSTMYAGAEIPLQMVGKAVEGITLVLDSASQLGNRGISSTQGLEELMEKAGKLQAAIDRFSDNNSAPSQLT